MLCFQQFKKTKIVFGFSFKNFSTVTTKYPRQIFSAIQPTGEVHLGNFLGAIQKWVNLQNSEKNPVIFSIADLHSITIPKDPQELNNNIFLMAATLLACGINTEKCILFQQSEIPQHSELCWVLSTITSMAKLSHLPQFKEKSQLVKHVPVGIFIYPVLQTADIMLYKATHVPVGEDQIRHIELANHLIKSFNNRFGAVFPEADALIDTGAGRIKSLSDPTKKMSKSDKNKAGTISLLDSPDEILNKCKKALTDFTSEITFEPETRPGVSNLLLIHAGLTGKTPEEIVKEHEHMDTRRYKIALSELIIEYLKPIKEKILRYLDAKEYLVSELENGANKAREIAGKTMNEVRGCVGFDLSLSKRERQMSGNV